MLEAVDGSCKLIRLYAFNYVKAAALLRGEIMQLMNKHGGDAVRGQPQTKVLLVKITSDSVDIVTVNMLLRRSNNNKKTGSFS